jgi:hypothetical protein
MGGGRNAIASGEVLTLPRVNTLLKMLILDSHLRESKSTSLLDYHMHLCVYLPNIKCLVQMDTGMLCIRSLGVWILIAEGSKFF